MARPEAMESSRGNQGVSELQARIGAIESQLDHTTGGGDVRVLWGNSLSEVKPRR